MNGILKIFICCCFVPLQLMGQDGISTASELSVEDLIKQVFIKGNCQNVDNITSIGNVDLSIGSFSNAGGIIGFSDGIILSSGIIGIAEGPNNSPESGFSFNASGGDPDLNMFATSSIHDLSLIHI